LYGNGFTILIRPSLQNIKKNFLELVLIFGMINFQFFVYDSSIAAPLSRVPVWPYSLTYQMPHKCHGNAQNCPSRYCLPTCTVYSVLPTPSPTKCRTNVTAMRRIAPAGTAYLPVQCTVYALLYHLPDATNSVTAMSRIAQAGTAYLSVQVYKPTYSLAYQMPLTVSRQCAELSYQVCIPAINLVTHLPDAAQVFRTTV
jgi:hypothetical protein